MQSLVTEGKIVLSVDLRGFGETAAGGRSGKYFGTDVQTALLSIHLNRPLLGQRVEDIVASLYWLAAREGVDTDRLELVGIGAAGPAALHAAALDARIGQVTLERSITSWVDVVNEPLGTNQLTNVVPFALEAYDLPDLARAVAPRKVIVRKSVDSTGEPKS